MMNSTIKVFIAILSLLVVGYAAMAMFYGQVVAVDGDAYRQIAVFVDVLKKISDDYVEAPNMQKVMNGAMRGLVESLDPYGGYFSKDRLLDLDRKREQQKGDVGLVLSKKPELVYVISVLDQSPAKKAGVRAGDFIISVDKNSTYSQHLCEVEGELRGMPGTETVIEVLRGSQAEPLEIKIRREEIRFPEFSQKILEDNVGYIMIPYLHQSAAEECKTKLKMLQAAGAGKLILDLRSTAGGDMKQALIISNFFIQEGLLGYTQGKAKGRRDLMADSALFLSDIPLVVMINNFTSGAAELIAGAIKDSKRGKVVGEKSFGQGSIQERIDMKDGSILILTTELYYTPSGKAIQAESGKQGGGILPEITAPDEKVKADLILKNYLHNRDENSDRSYQLLLEEVEGLQLRKALEVIRTPKPSEALQKAA